jgi:hypothetical protein
LVLAIGEIISRSRLLRSYRAPGVNIHATTARLVMTAPSPTVSIVGRVPVTPDERISVLEDAMKSVRDLAETEARRVQDRAEQTARDLASQVEAIAAAELKKVETLLVDVSTPDGKAYSSAILLTLGLLLQITGTILGAVAAT